ncbi:MAG: DUF3822 family protein [Clostridium sp.]|nr:DUF3822 family protein [Clostridium sp.]
MWRLSMEVHPACVDVVIYSPFEENSLICEKLDLDSALTPLAAFEELIYENPLLLSDFRKVDMLIDTPKFTFLPVDCATDDACRMAVEKIWPQPSLSVRSIPIPGTSDAMALGIDSGLASFISRTFLDTAPSHPIAALASYFSRISAQGNTGKIFAHLRQGAVDVIAFSPADAHGGASPLRIACSYPAPAVDDIVYFILASAKRGGFNLDSDEILLCGDPGLREQASAKLRAFAKYVMPVIFPSEIFKAGKAALSAPFELVILPLCE